MHLSSSSSCVRSSIWTCAEIKRATLVDPQVLVLQCRHTRRSRGRKEKASANKNGSRADIPSLSSGRPTNALWAWLVGRTWENRAREMQPGLCLDACTARSLNPRKNARTERFRGARLSFSSYLLSLTRPYRRVHGRRKTLGFRFPLSRDPSPGISHLPPPLSSPLLAVTGTRLPFPRIHPVLVFLPLPSLCPLLGLRLQASGFVPFPFSAFVFCHKVK